MPWTRYLLAELFARRTFSIIRNTLCLHFPALEHKFYAMLIQVLLLNFKMISTFPNWTAYPGYPHRGLGVNAPKISFPDRCTLFSLPLIVLLLLLSLANLNSYFKSIIAGGFVLRQLLDWFRLRFYECDEKAQEVVKCSSPDSHESYWETVCWYRECMLMKWLICAQIYSVLWLWIESLNGWFWIVIKIKKF